MYKIIIKCEFKSDHDADKIKNEVLFDIEHVIFSINTRFRRNP